MLLFYFLTSENLKNLFLEIGCVLKALCYEERAGDLWEAVQNDRSLRVVRCLAGDALSVGTRRIDFGAVPRLAQLAVVYRAAH